MTATFGFTNASKIKASQHLMDLFFAAGFKCRTSILGFTTHEKGLIYLDNQNYAFLLNGTCIINLLKDWSIHVINGPRSRWERFDYLTPYDLAAIIAFCKLTTDQQDELRAHTRPLQSFRDMIDNISKSETPPVLWFGESVKRELEWILTYK